MVLSRIDSFASGLGLEVHIRTTRVYRSVNMAYSYLSGAAVHRIGSNELEVLESGMLLINDDDATTQLVNEEGGRGNAAMADHRSLLISGYKIKSSAMSCTGASSSTTWTLATAIMFRFVQIP